MLGSKKIKTGGKSLKISNPSYKNFKKFNYSGGKIRVFNCI